MTDATTVSQGDHAHDDLVRVLAELAMLAPDYPAQRAKNALPSTLLHIPAYSNLAEQVQDSIGDIEFAFSLYLRRYCGNDHATPLPPARVLELMADTGFHKDNLRIAWENWLIRDKYASDDAAVQRLLWSAHVGSASMAAFG